MVLKFPAKTAALQVPVPSNRDTPVEALARRRGEIATRTGSVNRDLCV